MRFVIDLVLKPDDGGTPFTVEQVREHLQTYEFNTDTSFEMSLLPDDPDHELGDEQCYRTFMIESVKVTPVCPQTKFPDGTRCGEYDWHAPDCPERSE